MDNTLNNTMKLETVELFEDRINRSSKKEYFYMPFTKYSEVELLHLPMFSFPLKSSN